MRAFVGFLEKVKDNNNSTDTDFNNINSVDNNPVASGLMKMKDTEVCKLLSAVVGACEDANPNCRSLARKACASISGVSGLENNSVGAEGSSKSNSNSSSSHFTLLLKKLDKNVDKNTMRTLLGGISKTSAGSPSKMDAVSPTKITNGDISSCSPTKITSAANHPFGSPEKTNTNSNGNGISSRFGSGSLSPEKNNLGSHLGSPGRKVGAGFGSFNSGDGYFSCDELGFLLEKMCGEGKRAGGRVRG